MIKKILLVCFTFILLINLKADSDLLVPNLGNAIAGSLQIALEEYTDKTLDISKKSLVEFETKIINIEKDILKIEKRILTQQKNIDRLAKGTNRHTKALQELNKLLYEQSISEESLKKYKTSIPEIKAKINKVDKIAKANKTYGIPGSKAAPSLGVISASISALVTAVQEFQLDSRLDGYNEIFGLNLKRSKIDIVMTGVTDFFSWCYVRIFYSKKDDL